MTDLHYSELENVTVERNSNGNFIKLLDNHWQDRFTNIFFSKIGLAISNLSILITMMYFSYTAHPADPIDINKCDFKKVEGETYCIEAWTGLVDSQKSAINQRMATICLVGAPAALYVSLYFTKYLSIVIRAQGTTTIMGVFSTTIGVVVFTGFVLRASYCFSPATAVPAGAFCAKSLDPSFRILNNVLIQLGIMSGSTIILIFVSDFLIYTSVKVLWGDRYSNLKSYLSKFSIMPIVKGEPILVNDSC